MCLVLKLDNGKVVSIANSQTDRITEPSSTVLLYRFQSITKLSKDGLLFSLAWTTTPKNFHWNKSHLDNSHPAKSIGRHPLRTIPTPDNSSNYLMLSGKLEQVRN